MPSLPLDPVTFLHNAPTAPVSIRGSQDETNTRQHLRSRKRPATSQEETLEDESKWLHPSMRTVRYGKRSQEQQEPSDGGEDNNTERTVSGYDSFKEATAYGKSNCLTSEQLVMMTGTGATGYDPPDKHSHYTPSAAAAPSESYTKFTAQSDWGMTESAIETAEKAERQKIIARRESNRLSQQASRRRRTGKAKAAELKGMPEGEW